MDGLSGAQGREELAAEIEVIKDRIAAVYHYLGELGTRFRVKEGPIARSLAASLGPLMGRLKSELAFIEESLERARDTTGDPVEEWFDK